METPMKTETPEDKRKRITAWVESGTVIEAIGGTAAIILAIMGLTKWAPLSMAAVSAIVLGGALFLQGLLVAAEYQEILSSFEGGPYAEFGGGLGAESVAGAAAVVLGILALLDIDAQTLLGIAALVLGAGLALSSGVTSRLSAVKLEIAKGTEAVRTEARHAVLDASITQMVLGIVTGVLGLLSLTGISPLSLTLIAMLAAGVSTLYSGGALAGRMFSMFKH